jgi:hypothetical protein
MHSFAIACLFAPLEYLFRHILKGEMPADAYANGLQLPVIPDELKSLNKLEKQLISIRIPFMELLFQFI